MSFDIQRIQRSAKRIGKFLQTNSKRPGSRPIHNLRTSTRSLETTFTTLGLGAKGRVKRVLRALDKVRRSAGKVRDMDVLTAAALTVNHNGEQDCIVRLLEYLGAARDKNA